MTRQAGAISSSRTAATRRHALAPTETLDELRQLDQPAYQAVLLIVAGSYYTSPTVRHLLGYAGQQPRTVQIAEDIDEDLLMRVVERGPATARPDAMLGPLRMFSVSAG